MSKIAVLIPCYNESHTIAKVIHDFQKILPSATIYVYDNNSSDGTDVIARQNGAVVRYETRQGKGNVVRSMFQDIDADCYLLVDGDDTYPAEKAIELCKPILEQQADMVIGDRISTTYFTENKRLFHNFGNRLVRFLIQTFFHSSIHDIMTGYRAFSYDFVKSFPILSKGFEIETEMTIHTIDKNFKWIEIPIQYRDRPSGSESKLNTYKDGYRVLKTIGMLFAEYKPFLFFSIVSGFFLLFSFLLGIFPILEYWNTGYVYKIPSLIVASMSFVVGVLFFMTGIILQMIEKKHRKLYELYYMKVRRENEK